MAQGRGSSPLSTLPVSLPFVRVTPYSAPLKGEDIHLTQKRNVLTWPLPGASREADGKGLPAWVCVA